MQTETIEIPVEMLDKVTAETKKINASMDQVSDKAKQSTKGMTMSFTELRSAIGLAEQGLRYLKQGYDFAKEGAQIQFTQERFDRLAQSIGTTGDVLLGKMKEATKGTLSDLDTMAAATDLVALGLANTQEEAIRLATVQAGLAMDTNQLVLALTNQTTMRFDQLGVRVEGFQEKVDALKASGLSANDAFKEAFLQQAEEQLKRVGNAADSSAGTFARFEAKLKDAMNELKLGTSQVIEPAIKKWLEINDAVEIYNETQGKTNEDAAITWQQLGRNIDVITGADKAQRDYLNTVEEFNSSWDKHLRILGQGADVIEEVAANTEEITKANQEWLSTVGDFSKEYQDRTKEINKINEDRAEIEAKMNADLALGWWENSERILGYKEKLDDLDAKEREYTENYALNSAQRKLAAIEENLAKDGLTENEMQRLEDLGLAWGVYTTEGIAQARDFRAEVARITDEINNMPSSKTFTLDMVVSSGGNSSFGMPPEIAAQLAGRKKHATGTRGWETVPPGFPNDSFPVFMTSGEKYAVTTPGQSAVNGGDSGQSSEMISALYMLITNLPDDIARAMYARSQKVGRNA